MPEVVYLTGGTGFFGRRIAEAVAKAGFEVISTAYPEVDLMNLESTEQSVKNVMPDIIIHSAAYYGGLGITMAETGNLFYRNVQMLLNVLEAARKATVKRIMSIGSACAYPGDVKGDMSEYDYWSGQLHPSVEAYGFTKKIQQVGINAYHKQYNIKGQFPIITNLYGEHDVFTEYRSHVAAALIKRFADAAINGDKEVVNWGTGSAVREFLYVGDAAEGVAKLLKTDYDQPINIGTGIGTSIKELAELIAKYTGFKGEIVWDTTKPDGVPRKVLNVTKMKKVLNWQPAFSLEKGLEKTIKWYLANKERADSRQ